MTDAPPPTPPADGTPPPAAAARHRRPSTRLRPTPAPAPKPVKPGSATTLIWRRRDRATLTGALTAVLVGWAIHLAVPGRLPHPGHLVRARRWLRVRDPRLRGLLLLRPLARAVLLRTGVPRAVAAAADRQGVAAAGRAQARGRGRRRGSRRARLLRPRRRYRRRGRPRAASTSATSASTCCGVRSPARSAYTPVPRARCDDRVAACAPPAEARRGHSDCGSGGPASSPDGIVRPVSARAGRAAAP